ncbi:hypothetical protein Pmgp_01601 [Pelotomaculum propionicicum]|uniref:Uncharacterized protein n=1 Tax=Pelotomaculum propionicicum TaxID=258475 RepID=A0A4Y7RRT2_9FIRM|nr:hypothetical protein Pmgp_01601 [Pelotomaculum propionicicum]
MIFERGDALEGFEKVKRTSARMLFLLFRL